MVQAERFSLGFTLPELLITLSLVALVLSQITPDLSATLQQNRLRGVSAQFSQQLQLSRSEAIKRNRKVTLCKSDNPTQCNPSSEWESGWLLFENRDGDGRVDHEDTILQVHQPLPVGITLRGVGNFKNRITYKPSGDSTSFSRLVLCDQNQTIGAQLLYINSTGRIRIAADHNGNGIPEDHNGNEINSCET
ncbi:MAG: prepilin-type N-terminal cleavage/methylation domain-containing protein [Gammaproteobacteria bacterium]|jgi:type IV fimbrial biogenesis protein FimT|nr:prepilin-type N-terminal cleavage/methylation domain-containing protein [Gammaproteobacteria bacterium]